MKKENINLSKKNLIIIIVLAVVIIATAVTATLIVHHNKNMQDEITETTTESTTESTTQTTTITTTESTTETTTEATTKKVTTTTERETQDNSDDIRTASTANGWKLMLVNPWNKIPSGYVDGISLTQLKNGQSVDSRCYPDLQKMMDDCRKDGYDPLICSSFRSQSTQEYLYNRKIQQFKDKGYSTANAKIEAGKVVAVPGTSEHQLGLAVDIVDSSYQLLDEKQENTPAQKWLMQNSYKYGWILRYPSSKSSITGIIYEPWHYRYVGKEAAEEIHTSGVCLEEYLQNY